MAPIRLVVYTDIEAPADKLLTAEYDQGMLDDVFDTMRVAKGGVQRLPLRSGHNAGTTHGQTVNVQKQSPGPLTAYRANYVPCTTMETCMVERNNAGELEPSEDEWRFTPMAPADGHG